MRVGRSVFKVPGGKLVKVELAVSGQSIAHVRITGDFFLHPEDTILDIERDLQGVPLDHGAIRSQVERTLEKKGAQFIGATPDALARAVLMAASNDTEQE